MSKRIYISISEALRLAKEKDDRLQANDGICACYEVENMGFCKDGVTRWYHFEIDGNPFYTLKH